MSYYDEKIHSGGAVTSCGRRSSSGDASAVLEYYAYTMSGGKASIADFIAENK